MFSIRASTLEASVSVIRDDAAAALAKADEFAQLGLKEIAVVTDDGQTISREQLQKLVPVSPAPASERRAV